MRNTAHIVLTFLLLTTSLFAQKVEVAFNFKNITPVKTKEFLFTFGAHPNATDGLDTALGEVEIPNIPLPGGIYYVWTVAPSPNDLWFSPKEYRGLHSTPTKVIYNVNVSWSGGKLEVTWPSTLPSSIDSMWITDGYSDFPQNFVSAKVLPGAKFETDNPSLIKFTVIAWFKAVEVGVKETPLQAMRVYPHPVVDWVTVGVPEGAKQLVVTDIVGRELRILSVDSQLSNSPMTDEQGFVSTRVDLSNLSPGMYSIKAVGETGCLATFPIVHE